MEYKFANLKKEYANSVTFQKTEEILKECNFATKYQKILDNGTSEEQYQMGMCLVKNNGVRKVDTLLLASPLFYAAANNGHVEAQYMMFVYLEEDKHKDAIIYLKMAVEQNHLDAEVRFFRNYQKKRKEYLAEPKIFNKIIKRFEKSKDEDIRVTIGLYYENTKHDYKKAIKYYKGTLFKNEIERLKLVLYEQEHPSKALREEIIKKYPKIYKIVANKIVHCKNKSYA